MIEVSDVVMLRPLNVSWLDGASDEPTDLCAHGDVGFSISSNVLVDESNGSDLTVSAAALYLLRTLSRPHTRQSPVGDHLFPHCGFTFWDIEGQEDVVLGGCCNGVDFEVLHEPSGEGVMIGPARLHVGWTAWREAVFAFADRISEFYAACSPRQPSEVDEPGFRKFIAEWERRRGQWFAPAGKH